MKILYVLDGAIDKIGGSQKSTMTLAKEMNNRGYMVSILSEHGNFKDDNIYYYQTNIHGNGSTEKIKKIFFYISFFKKNVFDIVHVQNTTSFSLIGIALFLINPYHTKFLYTDRDFYDAYSDNQKMIFKIVSKKYDSIICTTQINANKWKNIFSNVKVVPNVLDKDWYEYSSDEKNKVLKEKYLGNSFVIGFSGRFVPYKRWGDAFEICAKLKDNEKFKFVFAIGSTPDTKSDELNAYIKKLKKELGEKLIILNNCSGEQMKNFYYMLDCFVLTSEKESFGRTLIEAMSKKCVVLGTDSGGVPDVIGTDELLFKVGDCESAVTKIIKLSQDKSKTDYWKNWLYDRVMTKFSIDGTVDAYEKMYLGQ